MQELDLSRTLNTLATRIARLYRRLVPSAYHNQVCFERVAGDCRIGFADTTDPEHEGHEPLQRPFSGTTAVSDFCAHAHKDVQNVEDGCTVVSVYWNVC